MAAVLIEKQATLVFSSDPAAGAENVSDDGSTFSVTIDSPLNIPVSAMSCQAAVLSAAIWNVSPNISNAFANDQFEYTTSVAPAGTYNVVLPEGLYSLNAINSFLTGAFVNNGHPTNLFSFGAFEATQTVSLTISTAGDSVDFSIANSVGKILGWPAPGPVIVAPVASYIAYAPESATLNRVNSYVITSTFTQTGIDVNGSSVGAIAQVPITARPGRQINYAPPVLQYFPADDLIGNPRQNISFSLLDQNLRPTPTEGEYWSVAILVRWNILLSSKPVPMRP